MKEFYVIVLIYSQAVFGLSEEITTAEPMPDIYGKLCFYALEGKGLPSAISFSLKSL